MYTRSYDEPGKISLPDGYSGTMLEGDPREMPKEAAEERDAVSASASPLGAFSSFLPKGLLGLFGGGKGIHIGTEELLILGAAAFLFFAKDGDKECALMLLLLIFIT